MEIYNFKEIFIDLDKLVDDTNNEEILKNFELKIIEFKKQAPKFFKYDIFSEHFFSIFESIKDDKNLISYNIINKLLSYNKNEQKLINLVTKFLLTTYHKYISKLTFSEKNSLLNNLIIKNLNNYNSEDRYSLLFLIKFDIDHNNSLILEEIDNLYIKQSYKKILKLINFIGIERIWNEEHNYGGVNKEFILILINNLISTNEVLFVLKLYDDYDNILIEIINLIVNYKKHDKAIFNVIKRKKFNINNYPNLIKHKKKKYYIYVYKTFGFEKLEEYYLNNLEDINIIIDIFNNDKDKKYKKYFTTKYLKQEYDDLKDVEDISNLIIENDNFGPIEYLINNFKKEDYLNLIDLNIKEEDVIFIDNNTNDEEIIKMSNEILSSKILGLDSEFYSDILGLNKSEISVFQIANNSKIYILDIISLKYNNKIILMLKTMFEDKNIVKLGHTFTSDITVFSNTFKINIDYKSLINIDGLVKNYLQKIGLKSLVNHYLNKEFCKYNQQSNWVQRPLRKSQIHYAALDAYSLLIVYDCINNDKNLIEFKKNKQKKTVKDKSKDELKDKLKEISENLNYGFDPFEIKQVIKKFENYVSYYDNNLKFIVDGMLKDLSKKLRNIGVDTEFIEKANYNDIVEIAESEKRIIITKDKGLIQKSKKCLVYNIMEHKTQDQLKEIILKFNITINENNLLKICAKCNNKVLEMINFEKASKFIKFKFIDDKTKITEFWKCSNCNQIFWEGNSYKKAMENYKNL